MHAIITSGMVSSNSLPDSPNRRGNFRRGGCSVVGWSSVNATLFAFTGLPLRMGAVAPPGQITDR